MRAIVRSGLLLLSVLSVGAISPLHLSAQEPPLETLSPPPATGKTAARRPAPAILAQALATVNDEKITRGELLEFLNRYPLPSGNEEQVYRDAIDTLVNTHLINQFLTRQRIPVSEEKVTQAIDTLAKQLKADGGDLPTELIRTGMSMDEVRKEYANRVRWIEYLNSRATVAELNKFAASHKDLFSGTEVKASHILLKVDPKATAAEKERIRQKLLEIKKDIVSKKTTFAEAANKFSEDTGNAEGAGGDVGYFTLNSGYIEEFANAAFALPKGAISDPVETPYGLHLILVTDRKEGKPFDIEQNRPFLKQMYAADLQKSLLVSERAKAKIDIKPMPADLFPPAPSASSGNAPASPDTDKPAARK
ncbi:MAG: peptidylprolyl isomerase [Isosphaeraceae bacterium]